MPTNVSYFLIVLIYFLQLILFSFRSLFGITQGGPDVIETIQLSFHSILCVLVITFFFVTQAFSKFIQSKNGREKQFSCLYFLMLSSTLIWIFCFSTKAIVNCGLSIAEYSQFINEENDWIMLYFNIFGSILDGISLLFVLFVTNKQMCSYSKRKIKETNPYGRRDSELIEPQYYSMNKF